MGALLSLRLLWGGVALVGWPFLGCGRGWLVGCVQSRKLDARASPSKIILLISFGDTLLVVSILNIVYNCHLRPLLQS